MKNKILGFICFMHVHIFVYMIFQYFNPNRVESMLFIYFDSILPVFIWQLIIWIIVGLFIKGKDLIFED